MIKKTFALLLFVFITLAYCQPPQQFGILKDFRFECGRILPECKVGYRTFGRMNEDSSNVILNLSWFGGSSLSLSSLIGTDKIIDSAVYFVIAIDALGNGVSSSPSNLPGLRSEYFPALTIRDMVSSQYRLATEIFHLKSVFAIVGGSMGSMQTLQWIVDYPSFMKNAVPYVCSPKLTSFDLLWMNWMKELIEKDKRAGNTPREIQRDINVLTAILARTPEWVVERIAVDTFYNYFHGLTREPSAVFTHDDYLAQLNAMIGHDIFKQFNGSMIKAAEAVQANVLMILSPEDHLVRPETSLQFAELLNCRVFQLANKGGHLSVGMDLKKCFDEITDFLNGQSLPGHRDRERNE